MYLCELTSLLYTCNTLWEITILAIMRLLVEATMQGHSKHFLLEGSKFSKSLLNTKLGTIWEKNCMATLYNECHLYYVYSVNSLWQQLYLSNNTKCFSYKGGCSICERTHTKAFKEELHSLGYRLMASSYYVSKNSYTTKELKPF